MLKCNPLKSLLAFTTSLSLIIAQGLLASAASAEAVNCEPDPGTDMDVEYSDTVLCDFETDDDTDIFHFVGNKGDQPFIRLIRGAGAAVSDYVALYLYSPGGALVARDPSSDGFNIRTAEINDFVLTEDGVHTIVAKAKLFGTGDAGLDYTLELPCLAGKCSNAPLPASLGYTAVSPCRIVDTRYGIGGYIAAGETRHFLSYGNVRDQNQAAGGVPPSLDYPEECPFALGEHEAVHLNVTVVSLSGGFGTLWPWNEARPAASFINYGAGAVVANAGVIRTTAAGGDDPDFSVYAHGNSHFIIDVLGYFSK